MMHNSPPDDCDNDGCPVCGSDDCEWEDCPDCGGDCEFDMHDDDPINYAPGEEYEPCHACHGRGGGLICHGCIRKAKLAADAPVADAGKGGAGEKGAGNGKD